MDSKISIQFILYKLVPYPWLMVPILYDIDLGIYASNYLVTTLITYFVSQLLMSSQFFTLHLYPFLALHRKMNIKNEAQNL